MQFTVGFDLDLVLSDPRPGAGEPSPIALRAGVVEAVEAVQAYGGQVAVTTVGTEARARRVLADLAVEVDAVLVGGGDVAVTVQLSVAVSAGVPAPGVRVATVAPAGAEVVLLDHLSDFTGWLADHVLDRRLAALETSLAGLDGLLVAFSGGADSAFLLAAAVRALGADRVVAATAVSPSLAADELPVAVAFAASLGVRHLTPTTDELAREGYVANGPDRCFHCKATLLDTLRPLAHSLGLAAVATGTNADDAVAGFRPGIRAAAQRGALTPVLDAALTKAQVREASRRWGLVTADKPALACLASRIAYGLQVTSAGLARVDRAERALRSRLGDVEHLRVRDLGAGVARVELDARALAGCDEAALQVVRDEGFDEVSLREFRSGSMNELLA